VQNSKKGKFLGILDLTLGEKGAIKNHTGSMVALNEGTTPSDKEVLSVIHEVVEKEKDLSRAREMEKVSQRGIVQ
jgi:2',3'-cyclic-nucleotide 2'-phosphodiesterase (5'-nucleotidase family)